MKKSEFFSTTMIGLFFLLLYSISHILFYLDFRILSTLPLTGIWAFEIQNISFYIGAFFSFSGWICCTGFIFIIWSFILIVRMEGNESKTHIFVFLSTGVILSVWDLFIAILPSWYYFPHLADLFWWYISLGIDTYVSIAEIVILMFSMLYLRKIRIRVMYEERGNELPH